jgi:hypothetical protein
MPKAEQARRAGVATSAAPFSCRELERTSAAAMGYCEAETRLECLGPLYDLLWRWARVDAGIVPPDCGA